MVNYSLSSVSITVSSVNCMSRALLTNMSLPTAPRLQLLLSVALISVGTPLHSAAAREHERTREHQVCR